MFTHHTHCRACARDRLVEVFNLGLNPLANNFSPLEGEHAGFAPLKVMFCPDCLLAQLSVVVSPSVLYSKYAYVTSTSQTMTDHFSALWQSIKDRHGSPANVMEIGSNDGRLLSFLRENGAEHVLGIDPAENLTPTSNAQGITTLCGLFCEKTARIASQAMPLVDVVIARHVFCHVDDWPGFIKALDLVCQRETLVVIEIPYVMDLIREIQFDTIYHEHLSYLNIKAVQMLLEHTPFRLAHVHPFKIHGGAIALYLRRRDFESSTDDDSVATYRMNEDRLLNSLAWERFRFRANVNIKELRRTVEGFVMNGKKVCGFGASAKSTVWINACGFNKNHLRFITDTTPQKQGTLSPGSDIPIVGEDALLREMPDYAVLFAWNYMDFVMERQAEWIHRGGRFIIPVPEVRIVPE